jgi:hypothetical protein
VLSFTSDIEGKRAFYGDIRNRFEKEGFHICSGWEYYEGSFDSILSQNGGVSIYLRLPTQVIQGRLDHEDAYLQFGRPFLIKHVVNIGISRDFNVLDMIGLGQFQKPLDPDDRIEHEAKWVQAGEHAITRIKQYIQ